MNTKVTHMTVVVKDQDKALDFYTNRMGFEKRADYTQPGHPRYLTVGAKGQNLEIVLWPAGAEAERMPASHSHPGSGTRTVIQVDDCRKTFADLKGRGVRFKDAEPYEAGWGIAADLTDPDGNPFTIFQAAPPPGAQGAGQKP